MDIDVYLAFVVATTVLILLPGPSIMLTVAHSLNFGVGPALMTVAGTTLAIVPQLLVTALGMTSVMLVLAEWFDVLRWGGVAYLVYLGIGQWRAGGDAAPMGTVAEASPNALFWHGFVVSAANPRASSSMSRSSPSSSTREPRRPSSSPCCASPSWSSRRC